MRQFLPFVSVLLLAACSSSSSSSSAGQPGTDGGTSPDVRPTFGAPTDLGSWGAGAAIALDRTGRAAIARLDESNPAFQLFDGTTWGDVVTLPCCSGPIADSLGVDRLNRFWVTDDGGDVTFLVAEPGVSTFHAQKTSTPIGGSYFFPSVNTLADGRVRYASPTENHTIALYEVDATLTNTKSLGSAGGFQSDTSEVFAVTGASDDGSVAVYWPSKIQNNETYSHELTFYQEGSGWDAPTTAPSGYDLVSFTVAGDGHALALWENQNVLAVSMRDPATRKFSSPKTLTTRDFMPITIADSSLAPAWVEADGTFTVVVGEQASIERFSIGPDGTWDAPAVVQSFTAPASSDTQPYVHVVERSGTRFVTWRAFGDDPALYGAFVANDGTWSDPASIGSTPSDYLFNWSTDLTSDGRAIALLEPEDSTFCATPALRHYTPSLGWGDLPIGTFDGCVMTASASITDDGTVSVLVEHGKQNVDEHVSHLVAR